MNRDAKVRAPAMSFIVRVWRDSGSSADMRGEIEHVSTGEKRLFIDYPSLVTTIDHWRQDSDVQVAR